MSSVHTDPRSRGAEPAAPERVALAEREASVRLAGGRAPWQVVATREVMVKLKDRNFVMGTVVTMLILAAVLGLNIFLASSTSAPKVAVVGAGTDIIRTAAPMAGDEGISQMDMPAVADAEAAVLDESVDAALIQTGAGWELVSKRGADPMLEMALANAVQAEVMSANASAAGTSMEALSQGSTLSTRALEGEDDGSTVVKMITGFAFAILFYMASMMFGMAIAQSVVEEKQSRVVEILATAMPIRQLLTGKTVGNSVLALGQLVIYIAIGVIGLQFTEYKDFLPEVLAASGWYLVFFLVGFAALACVWAAAGALATRQEDLQSTTTPLTTLLMLGFFAGMFASGTIQTVLSYVPVASSIVMPMRLLEGNAAWWEPIVSLVLAIAFAVAMILVGEKLYRRGLLQTSGTLGYRQAFALKD